MKLILELSGEHRDIPLAEIATILPVLDFRTQVAVVDTPGISILDRFAYTHVAMAYLGECHADRESFIGMLTGLQITSADPFCGRVKKMADHAMDVPTADLERTIGRFITGPVSLSSPHRIFRAIISGDRCYFGEVLWELDRNPYHERKPGKRPFFHPGVMMPRMIRSLVNMSGAACGDWILDPFCGTGGTLIEADLIGCRPVGSDADPEMIRGCRMNLPHAQVTIADARNLPFSDASIDHVVSDLPYGQSVTIIGSGLCDLYSQALSEIRRVVKPGNRSVIVTHQDIRPLAVRYFTISAYYEQRVHRSLTRRILIVA